MNTIDPPYPQVLHSLIQSTLNQKLKKKNSRKFQKAKLKFAGNYFYDIYIVFGITSNLKMINIWELINRLYEIASFYLRDLSIHRF